MKSPAPSIRRFSASLLALTLGFFPPASIGVRSLLALALSSAGVVATLASEDDDRDDHDDHSHHGEDHDNDDDGISNEKDDDIDGDGRHNGEDRDCDGDRQPILLTCN